jgi:hypothetical protein
MSLAARVTKGLSRSLSWVAAQLMSRNALKPAGGAVEDRLAVAAIAFESLEEMLPGPHEQPAALFERGRDRVRAGGGLGEQLAEHGAAAASSRLRRSKSCSRET